MEQLLEQWDGKFEVDGEIYVNLNDFEFNDGDDIHITLLPKRREIRDRDADENI